MGEREEVGGREEVGDAKPHVASQTLRWTLEVVRQPLPLHRLIPVHISSFLLQPHQGHGEPVF